MLEAARSVRILGRVEAPRAVLPRSAVPDSAGLRILGPRLLIHKSIAPSVVKPTAAPRSMGAVLLLSSALVFSIFQLYVLPVGGYYLSLGLMSAYALVFVIAPRRIFAHPLAKLFGALILLDVVSLTWSPDPFEGVRDIVFTTPFLITFLAARNLAERNSRSIATCMKVFCLIACVHSALIIVMAISPAAKSFLFSSPVGALFINPNSVNAVVSGAQGVNTSDPTKSGGFMGNANVAGAWASVALFATIAIMGHARNILWKLVALLHAGAIIACGSKASLSLLVLVPVAVLVAFAIFPPAGRKRNVLVLLLLGCAILGAALVGLTVLGDSHFAKASSFTLSTREVIWAHAWDEFRRTPLLGLGYGGWAVSFGKVGYAYTYLGIDGTFPPHNALIILWTQSGLGALLLGLAIIVSMVRAAAAPRLVPGGLRLAQGALAAYVFVIGQSMGENYGIFGDPHIQIPLAALLGWASAAQIRYAPRPV